MSHERVAELEAVLANAYRLALRLIGDASPSNVEQLLNTLKCRDLLRKQRRNLIEQIKIKAAALETAHQLMMLATASDGHMRNQLCTAANRLYKALGQQQSVHGEQF